MAVPEFPVQELKRRLDAGEKLAVLDVREPWEVAIASLPGSITSRSGSCRRACRNSDRTSDLVVMCKSGGRSRRAARVPVARGFGRVANLGGGIDAWAHEIDPSLSSY